MWDYWHLQSSCNYIERWKYGPTQGFRWGYEHVQNKSRSCYFWLNDFVGHQVGILCEDLLLLLFLELFNFLGKILAHQQYNNSSSNGASLRRLGWTAVKILVVLPALLKANVHNAFSPKRKPPWQLSCIVSSRSSHTHGILRSVLTTLHSRFATFCSRAWL